MAAPLPITRRRPDALIGVAANRLQAGRCRSCVANLIVSCNRYHRLLHHRAFRIDADRNQDFTFIDAHDHPIRPPDLHARHRYRDVPDTPRARSGGDPHYSTDLAVTAMASAG